MEEIILQQKDAAKALNGKAFVLGVAGIVLRLAIAQMAVNLLISLSGQGLLNIVFYVYAVYLLVIFMRQTVAAYVYTLRNGVLYLEKKLGDSTMSLIEVPICRVVSMRPLYMAERLQTCYRQVTVVDPAAKPTGRMRIAFAASLFSARLARWLAGKRDMEPIGHVIVFIENGERHACAFRPNEAMCAAIQAQIGDAYGFDERMTQARIHTLYARALQRAFPSLYAYVDPLVKPEDVQWAKDQIAAEKQEKAARKAKQSEEAAKRNPNGKMARTSGEKEMGDHGKNPPENAGEIEAAQKEDGKAAQTAEKRRRRAKQE